MTRKAPAIPLRLSVAIRRGSLPLVLAAAALSACAESPHQAIRDTYHQQDSPACRAESALPGTASAKAAGDAVIPPYADVDRKKYLACIARLGYQHDPRTDPLLRALDVCQKAALSSRAVSATTGAIATRFDRGSFESCMRQRGFQP